MKSLADAVRQLTNETEDVQDALNYAQDLANELGVPVDEVIEEIKRQGE